MATHETNPGPWPQTSAGLHMRADASETGRLARLADVVLWLIETQGLPRVPAVRRVADQLEAARPAPELFAAQPDNYARRIEGDAARFGYDTAETWAFEQLAAEVLKKMQSDPWSFNIEETDRPITSLPAAARAYLRKQFDEQGRRARFSEPPKPGWLIDAPGVPALSRLLRERWTWGHRLAVSPPVTSDAEAFAHVRLPGRAVAVRLTDAARIWGYGADWLPATVTEPTTFDELVAAVRGRRKGTPWSETEKALLRAEFQQRNGWRQIGSTWGKYSGVQTALAKELGFSARTALDRHLGDGPDAGATVAASLAGALIGKR